jgi:hypothetical protein
MTESLLAGPHALALQVVRWPKSANAKRLGLRGTLFRVFRITMSDTSCLFKVARRLGKKKNKLRKRVQVAAAVSSHFHLACIGNRTARFAARKTLRV